MFLAHRLPRIEQERMKHVDEYMCRIINVIGIFYEPQSR